jgi:hypothetical protein
MTDLNKDIASLVEKIDSMPAATRDGILNGLLTAKAERQERVVKKLYTPMQAAAADSRNLVLLKQVHAMCERRGYTLPSNDRVSLRDLDAALKASNTDLDERFRIKAALAQLNLL